MDLDSIFNAAHGVASQPATAEAAAPASPAASDPLDLLFNAVHASTPTAPAPSASSGLLSDIWGDIKTTPQALWETAKTVPSGVSNVVHLPVDLFNAGEDAVGLLAHNLFGTDFTPAGTDYNRINRTLIGTGKIAASIPGYVFGGPAGAAVTTGGYDKLLQLIGAEEPTTLKEDIANLRRNTVQGLVTTGAAKVAGAGIESLKGKAQAMDRKSLQTRASDYGKASDTRTIDLPEGEVATPVKQALNDLLDNNKLGVSRDPAKLGSIINKKADFLNKEIDGLISKFDESSTTPAVPKFDNATEYITSGKVPADQVYSYLSDLYKLEDAIKEQGSGKLAYLQEQKKTFGKSWDPANKVKSGFDRAVYTDLKSAVEKYVPEVKTLNQELQKYAIASPIVSRALKAQENASVLSKSANLGFTTGGVAGSGLLGNAIGGPAGAVIGAGVGLALRGLASPTGQALTARAIKAAPDVVRNTAAPVVIATQPQTKTKNKESSQRGDTAIDSLFSKGKNMDDIKQPIAYIEQQIDSDPYMSALYEVESSRGKKLTNDESSAKGAFQLIDATAKALGVTDPMDIAQNYAGAKKLTDGYRIKYGNDPEMLYAAHFLGETVLDKLLAGKDLTDKQAQTVADFKKLALPRFQRIYKEVLKKRNSDIKEA